LFQHNTCFRTTIIKNQQPHLPGASDRAVMSHVIESCRERPSALSGLTWSIDPP